MTTSSATLPEGQVPPTRSKSPHKYRTIMCRIERNLLAMIITQRYQAKQLDVVPLNYLSTSLDSTTSN